VITPNRTELAEATALPVSSEDHIIAAGKKLRQITTADAILVTRSEEGMTIVGDRRRYHRTSVGGAPRSARCHRRG
jgi:D-beta-D-heptose 7-phosphate kinase/D-beta-D-heptose 1-phosphate adenosyltransferase